MKNSFNPKLLVLLLAAILTSCGGDADASAANRIKDIPYPSLIHGRIIGPAPSGCYANVHDAFAKTLGRIPREMYHLDSGEFLTYVDTGAVALIFPDSNCHAKSWVVYAGYAHQEKNLVLFSEGLLTKLEVRPAGGTARIVLTERQGKEWQTILDGRPNLVVWTYPYGEGKTNQTAALLYYPPDSKHVQLVNGLHLWFGDRVLFTGDSVRLARIYVGPAPLKRPHV